MKGFSVLGMSKCAQAYLMRALKTDLSDGLIGFHEVSPGMIISEGSLKHLEGKKELARMANLIGNTPEDLAKFVTKKLVKLQGSGNVIHYVRGWYFFKNLIFGFLCPSYKKNRFIDESTAKRVAITNNTK